MTRQARHTWILVAVVLALGLAAMGETLRDARNAPRPLLADAPQRVDAIELACASCDAPRRFQRVQGRWRLIAPWDVPADLESVERLLGISAIPVRRRFGDVPAAPESLGLAPPLATVALGDTRIEFGTTEAIDQARFVRIGGQVALVTDRISVTLLAPPARFVDRNPFADLRDGLAGVVEGGDPWPAARVAALAAWRAESVEAVPADAPRAGRALRLRDGAGREHGFLLAMREDRVLLLRDDRPLAWLLPAGTTLPD
ncbi:MAG: hypothetical protein ACK59M_07835 [Pseudomonadota bacterium]|jgi:hypothetical protein